MLDNASTDGSAGAARRHPRDDRARRAEQRRGKGENDSRPAAARARALRLLLNEDSELLPGATRGAARGARGATPRPAPRAPRCCAPTARRAAVRVALPDAGDRARRRALPAPPLHRAEPRRGDARGRLGAVGGAARAPRGRARRSAGSTRRSSSTPTRSTSASACATPAGARSTCRPRAAIHHEQLSTGVGARAADRRAVAQPRPLHAQAPLRRPRRGSCGC